MSLIISTANEQIMFKKSEKLEFYSGFHMEAPTENAFKESNPQMAQQAQSPPVNLTCIIDRSGSMGGQPLTLVKSTMEFIIDHLRASDSLGIIDFGSDAHTTAEMTILKGEEERKKLKELVKGIYDNGGTNMSEGLSLGVLQHMSKNLNPNARAKVLEIYHSQAERESNPRSFILPSRNNNNMKKRAPQPHSSTGGGFFSAIKNFFSGSPQPAPQPALPMPMQQQMQMQMPMQPQIQMQMPMQQQMQMPMQQQMQMPMQQQMQMPMQQQMLFSNSCEEAEPEMTEEERKEREEEEKKQAEEEEKRRLEEEELAKKKAEMALVEDKDIKVVPEPADGDNIHTVFLLTDGHANEGISEAQALTVATQRAMRILNRIKKCTLFCFGAGSSHNEILMRNLVEIGNGMYYYIEKIDQIPESFAGALGGIMSILAQEIEVTIEPTSENVEIAQIETGYNLTQDEQDKRKWIVKIPDLCYEEKRDVLIKVSVKNPSEEKPEFLKFTVTYKNMILKTEQKQEIFSKISLTNDATFNDKNTDNLDAAISEQKNRIMTQKAMESAMAANNAQDAQKVLEQAQQNFVFSAQSSNVASNQLKDMLQNFSEGIAKGGEHDFQHVMKKKMVSQTRAVQMQRFAAGGDEDESNDMYSNANQKSMRSSAKAWK